MVERKEKAHLLSSQFLKQNFYFKFIVRRFNFCLKLFVNVVIPFYLQDARKLSASYAGLLMMVFPLLMVVGAPLSGYLTDKIGPGILTFGGLLLLCCTSLMYMF